jgi:hypothetical protein
VRGQESARFILLVFDMESILAKSKWIVNSPNFSFSMLQLRIEPVPTIWLNVGIRICFQPYGD